LVQLQKIFAAQFASLACSIFCYLTAGLRIEEGTAKFYLDVADGNLKDAIALYGELLHFDCIGGYAWLLLHHCHNLDDTAKDKAKGAGMLTDLCS